jgi:hypothetical protein
MPYQSHQGTVAVLAVLVFVIALVAIKAPPAEATVDQSDCTGLDANAGQQALGAAEALFTRSFPCILDELADDPPSASVLPLRTIDASGNDLPMDLSLQPEDGGHVPANPLVDLTLPANLGDEVAVGDRGIRFDVGATNPEAAEAATAAPLAGEGLFYANAAPATDVILAPVSQGLETVYQLRGPESPEHLQMNLTLPDGAALKPAVDGGAEVVQGGKAVASMNAPRAVDADGSVVSTTMTVDGTSLDLDVDADAATAYPVAVTVTAGSFAPAASAQATRVIPGIDGVSGGVADETSHAAALGVRMIRQHIVWCQLESEEGVYNRNQLQSIVDRVYYAYSRHNLKTLVELSTAAPVFARTAAMREVSPGMSCAHDGTGAASIASGKTGRYGTAMWKLALCLNNDPRCNTNLTCSPNCTIDTHGSALLDNGAVYGFEAGNEPNTTNFWQNGSNQITRTQANIYWNVLTAAAYAVHTYRPGALVGSAGLSYGSPNGHPWGDEIVDATSYLDQLLSNGQSGADAYSIHPYGPFLHPTIEYANGVAINSDVVGDVAAARTVLLGRGYGYGKPIWITEVGVDADYDDDNDVSANQEEGRQFYDLYYTWRNSIREVCSSWNVPLAVFWTFKDQAPYKDPSRPRYYAGFAKISGNSGAVDYSKLAYFLFNSSQALTDNTCTG